MKILITGGATREPIDGVRFITNFSTGKTAARLVDHFAALGDEVTYVHGIGAAQPAASCECREFGTFDQLDEVLEYLLSARDYDSVIHLAAVGDYSVASIGFGDGVFHPAGEGKFTSGGEMTLKLRPNFKIIERIKNYSRNPDVKVVGFKLTHTPSMEERQKKILKLARTPGVDLVVHNDLSELQNGIFNYTLYRGETVVARSESQADLAGRLAGSLRSDS